MSDMQRAMKIYRSKARADEMGVEGIQAEVDVQVRVVRWERLVAGPGGIMTGGYAA